MPDSDKTDAQKKAEFREWLEDSGVMDSIVKTLVDMYTLPEQPEDPLAFIRNNLGGPGVGCADKDALIAQMSEDLEVLRALCEKCEDADQAHKEGAKTDEDHQEEHKETADHPEEKVGEKVEGAATTEEKPS
ncbi:hypothetical protein M8J77_015767 [Diaphorina citri]|nr:hypothetical protein M8J77_015767 [Diaphorina citri]